jgi:hypothetical protein
LLDKRLRQRLLLVRRSLVCLLVLLGELFRLVLCAVIVQPGQPDAARRKKRLERIRGELVQRLVEEPLLLCRLALWRDVQRALNARARAKPARSCGLLRCLPPVTAGRGGDSLLAFGLLYLRLWRCIRQRFCPAKFSRSSNRQWHVNRLCRDRLRFYRHLNGTGAKRIIANRRLETARSYFGRKPAKWA